MLIMSYEMTVCSAVHNSRLIAITHLTLDEANEVVCECDGSSKLSIILHFLSDL